MLHQIYDIEHRASRISLGAIVMTPQDPAIFGIPIDFILFGLTLPGVVVFHEHTMRVALAGLVTVVFYKILLLSPHFETSRVPLVLPKYLPHDWKGGFGLLGVVWILSRFLDNIAGALIGGALAHQLFSG
jgi:hypothetical protein